MCESPSNNGQASNILSGAPDSSEIEHTTEKSSHFIPKQKLNKNRNQGRLSPNFSRKNKQGLGGLDASQIA